MVRAIEEEKAWAGGLSASVHKWLSGEEIFQFFIRAARNKENDLC